MPDRNSCRHRRSIHQGDFSLTDLPDPRIFQPRERASIGHVRVKHRRGLPQRLMNWCVDAVAGALDITGAAPDFAVVYPHLHQRRGGDFRPMHAERDLIIAIAAARHCQCEVVENPFAETVHEGEPVRGRKIDARLPFLGAALQAVRRNPDLHRRFLRRLFQHKEVSACSADRTWPVCGGHLRLNGFRPARTMP